MRLVFVIIWLFTEVSALIIIGRDIGVFATLSEMVLSFFLGSSILRNALNGLPYLAADTVCARALGGILLILPGFITDIFGLILLIPGAFNRLIRALSLLQMGDINDVFYRKIHTSRIFRYRSSAPKSPFGRQFGNHENFEPDGHSEPHVSSGLNDSDDQQKNTAQIIDIEATRKYETKD